MLALAGSSQEVLKPTVRDTRCRHPGAAPADCLAVLSFVFVKQPRVCSHRLDFIAPTLEPWLVRGARPRGWPVLSRPVHDLLLGWSAIQDFRTGSCGTRALLWAEASWRQRAIWPSATPELQRLVAKLVAGAVKRRAALQQQHQPPLPSSTLSAAVSGENVG